MATRTSQHAAALLIGGALLTGCATSAVARDHGPAPGSVAAIATELADDAELRSDPNQMRVLLDVRAPDAALAVVAGELERAAVVALDGRFHLYAPGAQPAGHEVTHTLVADFARRDEALQVSMRLTELEGGRIVASSAGVVSRGQLSDRARIALRSAPPPRAPAPEREPASEPGFEALAAAPPAPLPETVAAGPEGAQQVPAEGRPNPAAPPDPGRESRPRTGAVARAELAPAVREGEIAALIARYRGPAARRLNLQGRELRPAPEEREEAPEEASVEAPED